MSKAQVTKKVAAILRRRVDLSFAEFVQALEALNANKQENLIKLLRSGSREAVWKALVEVIRKLEQDKAIDQAQDMVTNQGMKLEDLEKVL